MTRAVANCPHRVRPQPSNNYPAENAWICRLVAKFVEGVDSEHLSQGLTSDAVCQSCCRFPVPVEGELNPVVASLVYRESAKGLASSTASVHARVLARQIREFSENHLATDQDKRSKADIDGNRLRRGPRRSNRPPDVKLRIAANFLGSLTIRKRRLGLVGWNSRFGLGHVNRDLASELGITSWLAPLAADTDDVDIPDCCQLVPADLTDREMHYWLSGLDVLLFMERPPFPGITRLARERRIPVVCIPNWEWVRPGLAWLNDVDLMICPTVHTMRLLEQWKSRFGFHWQVVNVPWPIKVDRFRFQLRRQCNRFLFIGGRGGCAAHLESNEPPVRRKAFDLVLKVARLLPQCAFIAYTTEQPRDCPANVELRSLTESNLDLYGDGDVCVQPSYWEGIGLPLLECQAAGLPLVTTDVAPMNEYEPLALVPIRGERLGTLANSRPQCIPVPRIDPEDLAASLASVHGTSIEVASLRARRFVSRHHSWSSARRQINSAIDRLVQSYEH